MAGSLKIALGRALNIDKHLRVAVDEWEPKVTAQEPLGGARRRIFFTVPVRVAGDDRPGGLAGSFL